ncbi:glycosyltransferase family 2 protein [Sphingobium sp. CAP-1]|uniref:glycosyltransferase family 2 protein n=1 Tax=Sphingobium sp. CAP-1 TaxID=2676077 RepID=UPI001E3CC385|nr:glycosyltransferase [Sphingobium sp. CAP-1]
MTAISIIIPSHNRRDLLRSLLDALVAQQPATPPFEVIIVADKCRDGTQAMVAAYDAPFPISLLEQPGVGPAHARNIGARQASADLLLFLDDDVIPTPGLVAAHAQAHDDGVDRAVLGPYPPEPHISGQHFRILTQRWWNAHFNELAQPGHRFRYTDLLTGNLSMPRRVWDAVGGLDPQFARAREDLELGVRLMKAGIPFHYAPEALGWHHEYLTTSLHGSFRRAKEEGRSDALMALKHPEMAAAIKAARQLRRKGRGTRIKYGVLRHSGLLDRPLMAIAPGLLNLMEGIGLIRARRRLRGALLEYLYARGAMEGLGPQRADFMAQPVPGIAPPTPGIDIDIADGIEAAELALTEHRPESARILYRGEEIATLSWTPMTERWSGRHLRPYLARRAAARLIPVLLDGSMQAGQPAGQASNSAINMLWINDFSKQLHEAQWQWARG